MSAIDQLIKASSKKEEYITAINEMLEKCNKESVFIFLKSFLEKQVQ